MGKENNSEKIHKKSIDIYSQINSSYSDSDIGIGMVGGKSGVAMFLFQYYKFFNEEKAAELGLKLLYECMQDIEEGTIYYNYSTGLAGFGYVIEHLSESEILDIDTGELLNNFDGYLKSRMLHCLEEENYDLLHGGLGVAYYFMKRQKKEIVLEFILKLLDISKLDENGYRYWEHEINIGHKKEIGVNFGFTHGLFSISAFFNRIIESDLLHDQNDFLKTKLIEGNKFIMKNKFDQSRINSFPTWHTPSNKMNYSRLAWCYGDLPAGLVLLKSAGLVDDPELHLEAVEILRKTLKRVSIEQENVNDAGFCHGSSGITYLYDKIYSLTGVPEFLDQANYWMDVTLEKAVFSDGYAGYKTFHQNEGWSNSIGLLEGISGIGLVLLSRLDEQKSCIDDLFLI
jgi:lantibiotic modifying enzyme